MPCRLLLTQPSLHGPNSFPIREGFGCLELYVRLTDDVEARVLIAVSRLFTDSPDGYHFYSRVIMIGMYVFDTYGSKKGIFRYVQVIFDFQPSSAAFACSCCCCCCCCCCGGGGGGGEFGPLGELHKIRETRRAWVTIGEIVSW